MNCIHCNAPDAHPGTRKCTDLQACHGRQEYARGVADERATPLTATPLGDALARAEEGVRYWTDLAQAEARDAAALRARVAELEAAANTAGADASAAALRAMARATKAEAERDALRAWVSAVSEALGAIEPVSDCRVELSANAAAALAGSLRAQVEAARAECERILDSMYSAEYRYAADHVLAAMDGAKP